MRAYILYFIITIFLVACKATPDSDRNYGAVTGKVYKLHVNPETRSQYYYEINNSSEMELEVDDKTTSTINKAEVGVQYHIDKDSAGNVIITMMHDKIHLYSKTGDKEQDFRADNASVAINPIEKMMIALKDAKVTAVINTSGEVQSISGYSEVGDKIINEMMIPDMETRNEAKKQWEQMIGERMIKKNMEDLFRIFPDSAVHLGDTWRLTTKQPGEVNMISKTTYTLKAINDDIAMIKAEGIINDDKSSPGNAFNNVTIDLNGKQQSEYEVETKTGMLLSCTITAKVEGTVQMMGREVPVLIKTKVKVSRRKVK